MRILIAWADDSSPNLGVRALEQGSVALLRRVWPAADFTAMNYGSRPPQIPWGSDRSLLKERALGRHGMMPWLADFDLMWDTRSGDSCSDIYGLPRHLTMSLVHEFASQAGTPVALAPQTIGPFRTARGRLLARRSLLRSRFVFARDSRSAEAAARLGRHPDAITSDLAFALPQPAGDERHDVLLNVSGLLWGDDAHGDAARYRATIRALIDGLLADGRSVALLPHVLDSAKADNDVPVSRALADAYGGRVGLRIPADLEDARAAIAGAQLVIGARMHACLNALSTGTPAIAMAYSRKFAPLMAALEWPHVVQLHGEDVAASVLARSREQGLTADAAAARDRGRRMLERVTERLAER